MIAWPSPHLPDVPGTGPAVRLHDTSSGELATLAPGPTARMYVCGITPYDATHLGHAATYLTFDLVGRALRDAGHRVEYVQNVTDVDDPLLERAARDGLRWQDLASSQVDLFREDMTALAIIAPDHYLGAVEGIPSDVTAIKALLEGGAAYSLSVPADQGEGVDVYLDLARAPSFGSVSGWDRAAMLAVYADRGGDPDRPGKRDVLDPLMWRGSRTGEPRFDGGSLGAGRPGWHIECSTIALDHLGMGFDIQGGGDDLIFPHHEMSAVQAVALTGQQPFAKTYVHQAMVGLGGEKMSKSKGNLVLVSALRAQGVDPMAIRLALLDHHYRTPWSWTDADLTRAQGRLRAWRAAAATSPVPADTVVAALRERVCDDLDSPGALRVLDQWAIDAAPADSGSGAQVATAIDALLGVRL